RAGLHVEAPSVQRTDHRAAFEPAFGEPGVLMGADVAGRAHGPALQVVHGDKALAERHALHRAFGDLGLAGDAHPLRLPGHAAQPSDPLIRASAMRWNRRMRDSWYLAR